MIVVVDDEDRENEGDLTLAADFENRPAAIAHVQVFIGIECDFFHVPRSSIERFIAAVLRDSVVSS